MPALVHPDKVIANDVAESTFKQCITVIEKKVRNLEKRKSKLDTYQLKQTEGAELNKDQKDAMSKYEVVMQNLDFARDLQKQFQIMLAESEKTLRKQAKRDKVERQQQEASRLLSLFKLETILSGLTSSRVKSDFLTGSNGAVMLTEQAVEQLNQFERFIRRADDLSNPRHLEEASEHVVAFLDGKEGAICGTTYRILQETVHQIIDSGYFNKPLESNCRENKDTKDVTDLSNNDNNTPSEGTGLSTSGSPSPLSCNSIVSDADSQTDSPPSVEAITAKLTLDEPESSNLEATIATNGHSLVTSEGVDTHTEQKTEETNPAQPFTFETADSGIVCAPKKDAREIVSAFDGHFNFLQESLIDEDWSFAAPQTVATGDSSYPGSVAAFCTSHAVFPTPVATYSANNMFPTTVDTFAHNYVADVVSSQQEFDSSESPQQPIVTYGNQFNAPLMTTMSYMAPPMMSEAFFAHHNVNYAHQVAYTTAYGPVMPGYPTEPIMTESHLDTATCIYQTNDNCMSAIVDDSACFETECSGLNPNASEFHSRFTPPPVDYVSNPDGYAGNEEDCNGESLDHADTNGDYQDVSRNGQNGFRGRGRFFRGGPRGGRFNNNRGGYGQRYRNNNYHRDGYNGDFNGSWRGYNRGGRGRVMNNTRGGRGFARNGISNQDGEINDDSNNHQ